MSKALYSVWKGLIADHCKKIISLTVIYLSLLITITVVLLCIQNARRLRKGGGGGSLRNKRDPHTLCLSPAFTAQKFNPLSPNSVQHQISPCNINAYSTPEFMRIKDMITC